MIQGEFRPLGTPIKEEHVGSRIDGYLSTHYPFSLKSHVAEENEKG